MGRVREELLDPWGGLVAAVAGGLAWAVVPVGAAALPLGLGVAAVVYGVKVGASLLTGRDEEPTGADESLPRPRRGSPARQWLDRGEQAQRSLAEMVAETRDPAVRAPLEPVRDGAAEAAGTLRRFAGQVTAVEEALGRVQVWQLETDRDKLRYAVQQARGRRLRAERERALDSITEQLAVVHRMEEARDTLLARMHATVLTVEGLVARAAEVLAMSASGGVDLTADRLAQLSGDLDGLRAGLVEAEEVSRRMLDG